MDLPEEAKMFQERLEAEETEDQTRDPFVPAKETTMDKSEALVYFEL